MGFGIPPVIIKDIEESIIQKKNPFSSGGILH
jgi:hypothetical protein